MKVLRLARALERTSKDIHFIPTGQEGLRQRYITVFQGQGKLLD